MTAWYAMLKPSLYLSVLWLIACDSPGGGGTADVTFDATAGFDSTPGEVTDAIADVDLDRQAGTISVGWSFSSTAACADWDILKVEARLLIGDVVVTSKPGPCNGSGPATGTVRIEGVAPGIYDIEVVAIMTDGHEAMSGLVGAIEVVHGQERTTPTIELVPIPATLRIDWRLWSNLSCFAAATSRMEVSLYYNSSTTADLIVSRSAACDATSRDPESGEEVGGIFLTNLVPNDDAVVTVWAIDSSTGIDRVRMDGRSEPFELTFGSRIDQVIALDESGR